MTRTLGAVLLALAAGACTTPRPPATPDGPSAVIDTLPGAIVRVRNPGPPALLPWRLVEERRILPAEGSPGELNDIGGVVATADGHVAVTQSKPAAIKLFAPDGTFLRSIGREGSGPGEFRQPSLGVHGDTLLAYDAINSRATPFLLDGTALPSWRAPCCLVGLGNVPVDSAGRAWLALMGREGARFERRRFDGTPVDTVPATPRDSVHMWTIRAVAGQGGTATWIPLAPSMEWGFATNGAFIYGTGDRYALAIGHSGRDTVRLITADAPVRAVTPAERDSLFRDAAPKAGALRDAFFRIAKAEDIPAEWPKWSGIAVDGANRFWVEIPGDRDHGPQLDIFSPEGVRLGRIPAPHPGILRGFWTADHVYLKDEDGDGRPMIRVYRLHMSATPASN